MDPELQSALAVVLADLCATTPLVPEVQESEWGGVDGQVTAMLQLPEAGGAGIWVLQGADPSSQVAELAAQVQDWAIEALWRSGHPPVWPGCPHHPSTHPLRPVDLEGRPVWMCPRFLSRVADIGTLAGP